MEIKVNGELKTLVAPMSVQALIAELGLNLKQVAVERNLEIVPRSAHANTVLCDGDQVEIVHFIGGG